MTTFAEDLDFLRKYTEAVVLRSRSGDALVLVAPALQGRVLTSSAQGDFGISFGFINRSILSEGKILEHINPYGGEDRFWIGPEGGQFAVFFRKDDPFDYQHWQTPAPIDSEPFKLVSQAASTVTLRKEMRLTNWSGTEFCLTVDRKINLLGPTELKNLLGGGTSRDVKCVGFESENTITNTGEAAWMKKTGLLSIWILGMFNPTPGTSVVIPFKTGPESELGPVVNDAYFGKVPADRLAVKDGFICFKGDGQHRSKIGLLPARAKTVLGSYDSKNKVLTIVRYTKPDEASDYVNSMWEVQKHPYKGDVVNSYNDGPVEPGKAALGSFYELETSSPAAALKPGKSLTHLHQTFHMQGPEDELDKAARAVLGTGLADIRGALKK